ncbi:unnamed protein product [Rhizophagus irregularis]|nr:unnamed protein product [Rhizophagus irregularis]
MLQRFRSLNLIELSLEHCDVKKIVVKGEQKRKERMKLMSRLTTRKERDKKMRRTHWTNQSNYTCVLFLISGTKKKRPKIYISKNQVIIISYFLKTLNHYINFDDFRILVRMDDILNDKHNVFKYRNLKSQRSKKNRRGKNKWILKEKTAVDFISYIEEKRQTLLQSDFFQEVQETINNKLFSPHRPKIVDIVCYGIGSIEKSIISQYQFALVLILRDLFEITGKAYAYDPVSTPIDLEILLHYEINTINANEKAKRPITNQTLFYMPHCPLGLYNNVIASNWERNKLEKIILVGNRLDFYDETMSTTLLNRKAPYISSALTIIQSVPFPSIYLSPKYDDNLSINMPTGTFDNLCWQWFPIDGELEKLDGDIEFWGSKTTLEETEDLEII